jgi:hypothetical protein
MPYFSALKRYIINMPAQVGGSYVPGGRLFGPVGGLSCRFVQEHRRGRPRDFTPAPQRSYQVLHGHSSDLTASRGCLALPAELYYHIPVHMSSIFFKKNKKSFFKKGVDKYRPIVYNITRSREEPKGHWDLRRTCLSFLKVKDSQINGRPAKGQR